ncbi:MAG: site-2 protease family protein [Promicromonosporaceae bacterium]|nr:site-2 protease family protein [Promicromonosporaceae bacterium]
MNFTAVLVGILVVVFGVGFSIGVHELGHMIPAKIFGVRVDKYMIGFGPTIWSRQIGETLYGIKLLPLGGFCRMIGMLPPAPPGTVTKPGYMGEVVAQAREDSVSEILPGEEYRAFYNLSAPKKILIMAGGILANLLLVFLFAAIAFSIPTSQPSNTLASVSECLPVDPNAPSAECVPAPAAVAGLRAGDTVTWLGGHRITNWTDVTDAIAAVPTGATVMVTVERDGLALDMELTPVVVTRASAFDAEGNPVADADGVYPTITSQFVGIGPSFVRQTTPLTQVPRAVGQMFTATAGAVIGFPVAVFEVARSLITGAPRPADGVMSVVGVGRAAAEIAGVDAPIADIAATMVALVASLNMALFAFNLIPLLPFDGGHVVNALYEGGRRTIARMRGIRPLPGPADVARTLPIAYVVTPLLVLAFIVLILADIISPISVFG